MTFGLTTTLTFPFFGFTVRTFFQPPVVFDCKRTEQHVMGFVPCR